MKLLADKDERFKGLFVKVAIFVLLAATAVALNLLFSGIKKGVFSPKSAIYFIADSGLGIREGTPVTLSGFKIGSVRSIALDNLAQARVEMAIENQYLSLLDEDAMVSLKKEGIIGDSILEARRGTVGRGQLPAGATIGFERSGDLEQITHDLRDRLLPAIDEVNKLLHDANDPQGDVRQTLKNMHKFSVELHDTQARVDRVLEQIDKGIAKDVRPILSSASNAAENAASMTEKLGNEVPVMVNKVDATLDNLRQASETIKSAVTNAAPQLHGVMEESRGLISGARNIEDSLSTSWPLKNIMPPPEQGLLRMDSHD